MANAIGDILRVAARLHHELTGDMVNVFHYRIKAGTALSDVQVLDDIALGMDTLYTEIVGDLNNTVGFADINIFNESKNAPVGTAPWPSLTGGTSSSHMLPSTVAAFVRATTGQSRNWAKKFIGGLTEDANTSTGVIGSGVLSDLASWGALWLINIVGSGTNEYEPVVHHNQSGTWRLLTDIIIRNVWAQVRKRRIGRGS